jgi:hypothetical protein
MHADVKKTKPVLFVRLKPALIDWLDKEVIKRGYTKAALLEEILLCAKKGMTYSTFSQLLVSSEAEAEVNEDDKKKVLSKKKAVVKKKVVKKKAVVKKKVVKKKAVVKKKVVKKKAVKKSRRK